MPTLCGKTVLITGAARGIGAALAQRMHHRGANVGLEGELLALCAVAQQVRDRFGSIDVAVANAGIAFAGGLVTSPVQHIERTIDVNLMGVWRTDRAVAPHLAYTASKAGAEASDPPHLAAFDRNDIGHGLQIFSASMRSCGTTENLRPVGRRPASVSSADSSGNERRRPPSLWVNV